MHANILGLHHLYEAVHKCGVKRVIYASSSHVVGFYPKPRSWSTPSMPLRPDGFYGMSKAFGEALSRYYYDRFGIETVCLRIGSSFPEPKNCAHDGHLPGLRRPGGTDPLLAVHAARRPHDHLRHLGQCGRWWDNREAAHLGYVPQRSSSVCAPVPGTSGKLSGQTTRRPSTRADRSSPSGPMYNQPPKRPRRRPPSIRRRC
jgi:uronate dehydrogenase